MVSLWPWKKDETSAASFEKSLSSLSSKIAKARSKEDNLRQRSRRFKALWTLYTVFAYTIYTLIQTLVTGWRNWTYVEYGAVAGGPLLIYGVRLVLAKYYEYRVSSFESYLKDLNTQRQKTIDKLKAATKYDSTKHLLDKYGNDSQDAIGRDERQLSKATSKPIQQRVPSRTNIPPPPTANIPRRETATTSERQQQETSVTASRLMQGTPPGGTTLQMAPPGADFAPNAYNGKPRLSHQASHQPHWYDRMMDLILGEDETRPQNRMVLMCRHCKLVNGQAPPGVKSPEDVGTWRCCGCKGWNGTEDETRKLLKDLSRNDGPQLNDNASSVGKSETELDSIHMTNKEKPSSEDSRDSAPED